MRNIVLFSKGTQFMAFCYCSPEGLRYSVYINVTLDSLWYLAFKKLLV